jgi:hypothetical protein
MRNRAASSIASIGFACLVPSLALAGPGADVNACVYFAVAPNPPVTVNFTAGGGLDHCIISAGQNTHFTASRAGITCGPVGYIEAKESSSGGDTCATADRTWSLAYSIPGTSYSGSTLSSWTHKALGSNHMSLVDASPGTNVCGEQAQCTTTTVEWSGGTQGPLFIIFSPLANSSGN